MQVAETFTTEFTQAMIQQGELEQAQSDNDILKEM
jgi:hypothetical protein